MFNPRDAQHRWVHDQLGEIRPPLLSCEAVLAEACHLLEHISGVSGQVVQLLSRGFVAAPFRVSEDAVAIERLMTRYANVPMSLADACLVRMAERIDGSAVLTFDGDFRIYRKAGRQVI